MSLWARDILWSTCGLLNYHDLSFGPTMAPCLARFGASSLGGGQGSWKDAKKRTTGRERSLDGSCLFSGLNPMRTQRVIFTSQTCHTVLPPVLELEG